MLMLVPRARSLIFLAAFAAAIAVSSTSPCVRAQSAQPPASRPSQTTPEWQIAAGGKMEFEVASIKPGEVGNSAGQTSHSILTTHRSLPADASLPTSRFLSTSGSLTS
jgi:hypothetical protein